MVLLIRTLETIKWFRLRDYDVYLRYIFFPVHIQNTEKRRTTTRRPCFKNLLLSFLFAASFEFIHTDANTSISNAQQVFFFLQVLALQRHYTSLDSQVIFILPFLKS